MTKYFKKIREGINYFRRCPFCKHELFINENGLDVKYKNRQPLLKFNLIDKDLLYINIDTEEITTELHQNISSHGYFHYGTNYQGINIECFNYDCGLFDFTLQLQINVEQSTINYIMLNSERISFEDSSGNLYEVKNIYSTNITEYTSYSNDLAKTEKLPLVPIDFKNPEHTIRRIKKLIIFS